MIDDTLMAKLALREKAKRAVRNTSPGFCRPIFSLQARGELTEEEKKEEKKKKKKKAMRVRSIRYVSLLLEVFTF